jgi:hypothetical protein
MCLKKNLLMFALQDFTIIDGKRCLGATSFTNKFLLRHNYS